MKPLICAPMGDPAGVGPEILAASLADAAVTDMANVLVVGNTEIMRRAAAITSAGRVELPVEGGFMKLLLTRAKENRACKSGHTSRNMNNSSTCVFCLQVILMIKHFEDIFREVYRQLS